MTGASLLLALTGFAPLVELDVIGAQEALDAVGAYLDRLFT